MGALFASVALMNIAMSGASTAATLIAAELGGARASGLPNAAGIIGTAVGALSIGSLMGRVGRRRALMITYGVATGGAIIATLGAVAGMLEAMMVGMALLGLGNGGAQLSRYVAAELYPAARKGTALSAIVWSGTVGAIVGPALIAPAADGASRAGLPSLAGPVGVAAVVTGLAIVATAALPNALSATTPKRRAVDRSALRRPAVRLSIVAMAAAHVTMVSIMLMTPVQLHQHGHGLEIVGMVLSAHMIGMFALAPLSGRIADRFGGRATIAAGMVVLLAAAALAASTPTSHNVGMPVALFLLGYGWNLAFVGGSSVLSRDLPEETRIQLQGLIDAIVWGSAAIASLSAGPLFGIGGYPLLAVVAGLIAMLPITILARRRRAVLT